MFREAFDAGGGSEPRGAGGRIALMLLQEMSNEA